ncbi:MAG: hypothetical protein RMM31_11125 [Anaerolineae bacterium]|nr:hypothetical protein [Thermoflexales bacterium]MDW8396782.1 hypothetical protein [Anaerolineae bacterium]
MDRAGERSFEPITDEDLHRLVAIARAALEDLCQRKLRWAPYRARILAIALCQGAACHHLDGRTGIKDFDVWFFFAEVPGNPFPHRWRPRRDFGASRFGHTPGFRGVGRRVDVLGRSLPVPVDADPVATLQDYFASGRTASARALRQKAAILLYPPELWQTVVWRGCAQDGFE